jgi:hypothetical protein
MPSGNKFQENSIFLGLHRAGSMVLHASRARPPKGARTIFIYYHGS